MISIFTIGRKNLLRNKLTAFLNITLVAFGIGILSILMLATQQISSKLEENAKDIDVVVGAKGSPLQLILSSIYHIDFPTGNIPVSDARKLAENPMVRLAVPLALGDNYMGNRIVGTDQSFIALYGLDLGWGKFWEKDLETTIGSEVARTTGLKVGDTFFGAHGLSGSDDVHKQHAYRVMGILKPQGNVTDQLILTNIGSVYKMHEGNEHQDEHQDSQQDSKAEINNREITALLIQYRSPMSVVVFPRMVNKSTNMQAASPAMESARLFSLIGIGIDTLKWFAAFIMLISGLSIFISLYNSMKERKYDLAIMRCLGASKFKLFFLVLMESLQLTVAGAIVGILIGHGSLYVIGFFQEAAQAKLNGFYFMTDELYLLLAGIVIGVLAALLPAFQVFKVDIAKTLTSER
ncbi:ABC transporter permease [Pedobacter sp. BMA]|uniref:ABC transporter permease n=1 Tax=Pedobacter sp. BMA TaxID=1663685 RepID=UPI000B32BDE2